MTHKSYYDHAFSSGTDRPPGKRCYWRVANLGRSGREVGFARAPPKVDDSQRGTSRVSSRFSCSEPHIRMRAPSTPFRRLIEGRRGALHTILGLLF